MGYEDAMWERMSMVQKLLKSFCFKHILLINQKDKKKGSYYWLVHTNALNILPNSRKKLRFIQWTNGIETIVTVALVA